MCWFFFFLLFFPSFTVHECMHMHVCTTHYALQLKRRMWCFVVIIIRRHCLPACRWLCFVHWGKWMATMCNDIFQVHMKNIDRSFLCNFFCCWWVQLYMHIRLSACVCMHACMHWVFAIAHGGVIFAMIQLNFERTKKKKRNVCIYVCAYFFVGYSCTH